MSDKPANGAFSAKQIAKRGFDVEPKIMAAIRAVLPKHENVIDIGAGNGRYVKALREAGYHAWGIDGAPGVFDLSEARVHEVDLTDPDFPRIPGFKQRNGICLEVGEHIPEESLLAFVRNVSYCVSERLILSWATPGQRGSGHVSCLWPEEVAAMFQTWGLYFDHDKTTAVRKITGRGWDHKIMVLRKDKDDASI